MDRILRQILSDTPAGRAYLAKLDAAKKAKRARHAPSRKAKEAKRDAAFTLRAKVYAAVDKRSGGTCECFTPSLFCLNDATEHDHFWGRGKAKETPENVWHLCAFHHANKTNNDPDRAAWIRRFRDHCFANEFWAELEKCDRALALEIAQHPRRTP